MDKTEKGVRSCTWRACHALCAVWCGVLVGWGTTGCTETTQLRIDIVGDFQVPDDIERLVIEFRGDEVTFQTSHELRNPLRPLAESFILYPGPILTDRVDIRVRGQRAEQTVAVGTGSAAFVQDRAIFVQLHLQSGSFNEPDPENDEEDANDHQNLRSLRWLDETSP